MAARQSAAVDRALARVVQGASAYAAAREEGVCLSTIYRALERHVGPDHVHGVSLADAYRAIMAASRRS